MILIGSLRKGVFERRTATRNETFSLFTRLGATTFVILSVFTLIETIYLKVRAHPLPKNEKRPLPVAVRRSKTPLLKLPTLTFRSLPLEDRAKRKYSWDYRENLAKLGRLSLCNSDPWI